MCVVGKKKLVQLLEETQTSKDDDIKLETVICGMIDLYLDHHIISDFETIGYFNVVKNYKKGFTKLDMFAAVTKEKTEEAYQKLLIDSYKRGHTKYVPILLGASFGFFIGGLYKLSLLTAVLSLALPYLDNALNIVNYKKVLKIKNFIQTREANDYVTALKNVFNKLGEHIDSKINQFIEDYANSG